MFKTRWIFILTICVPKIYCTMEGYMVRGDMADIYNYPHSAYLSLSCRKSKIGSWMCGSSIINQDIVLTAAHCLYACKRLARIQISAGSSNKNAGHITNGIKFVLHESYDSDTNENDIALVKMKQRPSFGETLKRVVIMKEPPSLIDAEVAGWGLMNDVLYESPANLMSLSQVIWNKEDCEGIYGTIAPGTFCAGSAAPGRYVAQGDSGSALMIGGYIQIGIVSYKIPLISKNLIVYTNTSYFYEWMRFNAWILCCRKK